MVECSLMYDELFVQYEKYDAKIKRHAGAYEMVYQSFTDEVFGNYNNRVTRRDFIANLGSEGWKYFNFYSLNGIFVQKFNEQPVEEKG